MLTCSIDPITEGVPGSVAPCAAWSVAMAHSIRDTKWRLALRASCEHPAAAVASAHTQPTCNVCMHDSCATAGEPSKRANNSVERAAAHARRPCSCGNHKRSRLPARRHRPVLHGGSSTCLASPRNTKDRKHVQSTQSTVNRQSSQTKHQALSKGRPGIRITPINTAAVHASAQQQRAIITRTQ